MPLGRARVRLRRGLEFRLVVLHVCTACMDCMFVLCNLYYGLYYIMDCMFVDLYGLWSPYVFSIFSFIWTICLWRMIYLIGMVLTC